MTISLFNDDASNPLTMEYAQEQLQNTAALEYRHHRSNLQIIMELI